LVSAVTPARVELLEPGAEPHARLRFEPTPGPGTWTLTLRSTMAADLGMVAVAPTRTPALKLHLATDTQPGPDDTTRLHLQTLTAQVVSEPGTSAALGARLQSTLAALGQLRADLVLGRDGGLREIALTVPTDGAQPPSDLERLREAFSQAFVALPEQAVGIGARWTVTRALDVLGSGIEQRAELTLREREGQRLVLALSLTQVPALDRAASQGSDGVQIRLDHLATHGEGELVVALDQIVPVSVHSRSHSEVTQTIERDGQRQQVDMTLDFELDADSLSPRPP
jgi:hypothetical protein